MAVILVGGGARSGKSAFAQRWIEQRYPRGVFVATAEARDQEMRDRIEAHQRARGPFWTTVEEPLDLCGALEAQRDGEGGGVLVDCLTLWLSNILLADDIDEEDETGRVGRTLEGWSGPDILLITNEVGCGIVPDNALARRYRDLAGRLNQLVAAKADEVYWMVFGCPLEVKLRR